MDYVDLLGSEVGRQCADSRNLKSFVPRIKRPLRLRSLPLSLTCSIFTRLCCRYDLFLTVVYLILCFRRRLQCSRPSPPVSNPRHSLDVIPQPFKLLYRTP